MAKKPASLEAALGAQTPSATVETVEVAQHQASAARATSADEKITGYIPPAAKKRLRLMCIEHDRDINSYIREGIDMVLKKYGQPSLAECAKK